ncbi:hypothetical protein DL765_006503 [Monosporascus sp. GIB2]|nr:hypothetical protein DL765_006503 [Monosporascus sp. GIB2]
MIFSRRKIAKAAATALLSGPAAAQTWTACNPLTNTCPPNTALGMAIDVDFTQGGVNSFKASGGTVTYDSNGAAFTVTRGGDAPQLSSVFFIMFGRVEFTLKAAPGAGIVSFFVLQSDCLDEIDWNSTSFRAPRPIILLKFGVWSGGDPNNSPGTIDWLRGPTDYSQGPFTMYVKSVKVTDYSTGSSYIYGDSSGIWQSIRAEGGEVNGNEGNAGILTITAVAAGTTFISEANVPVGGIGGSGDASSGLYDVPEGWVMIPEGKIVPIGSFSVISNAYAVAYPVAKRM